MESITNSTEKKLSEESLEQMLGAEVKTERSGDDTVTNETGINKKKTRKEKKSKKEKKAKEPKPEKTPKKKTEKKSKKEKKLRSRGFELTLSFKNLNRQIRGWGYEYNGKKFMATIFLVLAGMVALGYFYLLKTPFIAILAVAALIAMPLIVLAQFAYISNNDRFEEIVNYLEQMILSFKQNPKILAAMEDSLELATGRMRTKLEEAIYIIKNDTTSENVYEKAFKVIENEFRCSRIKTLHRFMLNVETENSTNYQESIDNLYSDIRSWVTRTYQYQAGLAATKTKIMIIMGLSLGIALFFTYMLKRAEETTAASEAGNLVIVGSPVYQVATTIFILLFIIIYTFLNTKVNGFWLVNDISDEEPETLYRYMEAVDNYDPKASRKSGIIAALIIGVPVLVIGFIIGNIIIKIAAVGLAFFVLFKGNMGYKSKKKAIERELKKEFPIWLRDIAVNLNNMVVVRAVAGSYEYAAPILKPFIENFVRRCEEDPTSFKPYTEFLGVYSVSEISTAMKMLYAIKMLSEEDSSRQVNELIDRNQALLEESEKIKQEDSIAGVSFISLLPMLLMSLKMLIDLGVMLVAFMSLANGAM